MDRAPVIPSHEFSGVVVGHGADAPPDAFPLGSEVFGLAPFDHDGAAAEYVAVPAANLALKPARVSHIEASALPLAAATAWQALQHHAAVRPGDRVLVVGGAGAVGSLAVQIAAVLGAEVTATVLHSHLDFVQSLGADRIIDVDLEDLDGGPTYDVVIDTVGGQSLERAFGVVRRGGRLVTLQAPVDPDLARERGIEAIFFIVGPDLRTLVAVADLAATGKLHIEVAATYPLTDGRAAYLSGALSPRPPGKTVLVVRPTGGLERPDEVCLGV